MHANPAMSNDHARRGMLLMLLSILLFSLMDAGLKTLSAHYPPFQVAALRGASSLPLVLAWALLTVGWRPLLRVRWPLHLLRGVLGIMMMASFVYALGSLPLSTAYSIFFVAPLLITALSVPILGERVGPRRWTAIGIGLIGVLVVLRPTDVPGLLEDVRRACLLRAGPTAVQMDIVCESDGLIALADSQRLAQVLNNLTSNAVKYGAAGGRVILRASRADDNVKVEVIDFGPGLSVQKQGQLFEPFNRLGLERSTIEGHGVGLALAKRLIELQGGSIGVTSTPGEGATFWILIPTA